MRIISIWCTVHEHRIKMRKEKKIRSKSRIGSYLPKQDIETFDFSIFFFFLILHWHFNRMPFFFYLNEWKSNRKEKKTSLGDFCFIFLFYFLLLHKMSDRCTTIAYICVCGPCYVGFFFINMKMGKRFINQFFLQIFLFYYSVENIFDV